MGELVYGSELSLLYKKEMKEKIDALKAANKKVPCLAVILVGKVKTVKRKRTVKKKHAVQLVWTASLFILTKRLAKLH